MYFIQYIYFLLYLELLNLLDVEKIHLRRWCDDSRRIVIPYMHLRS